MEIRRTTRRNDFGPAVRLACALSIVAGIVALALDAAGVGQTAIVLMVIVVGFTTSWVRTSRVERAPARSHRLATIPLHGVSHPVG